MAEEKNDLFLESGPTMPVVWDGFDTRQLIIPEDATDEEALGVLLHMIRKGQMTFYFTEEARSELPEPYCNWEFEK